MRFSGAIEVKFSEKVETQISWVEFNSLWVREKSRTSSLDDALKIDNLSFMLELGIIFNRRQSVSALRQIVPCIASI